MTKKRKVIRYYSSGTPPPGDVGSGGSTRNYRPVQSGDKDMSFPCLFAFFLVMALFILLLNC